MKFKSNLTLSNLIHILSFITIANLPVIANTQQPPTLVVSDLDASPMEPLAKTGRCDKSYRTIKSSNQVNHKNLNSNEYQTVAFVRTDANLNHLETRFITKHANYRTQNLAKFLNPKKHSTLPKPSPQVTHQPTRDLKIAFCFSGGGYRTMIYSLGILLGAEKINLLPAVSYLSCLSGSTWSVGAYLSGNHKLCDLRDHFKIITQNNLTKFYRLDHLFDQYLQHKFLHESSNLILLWGSLLANQILNHVYLQKFSLRLSEQQYFVEHCAHLLPIYTAVIPNLITTENLNFKQTRQLTDSHTPISHTYNYNWLEFTPYEVSYITELAAVPSWAFGREFNQGISQSFTPELPFAYLMGIFGSAFTANLTEIYRETQPLISVPMIDFRQPKLNYLKHLPHLRILPAKINNFAFNLELEPTNLGTRFWGWDKIKTKIDQRLQKIAHSQNIPAQKFTLLDAGIDFNLPLPPLLKPERQIDVIIIADISGSLPAQTELAKALKYAREQFNLIYAPEKLAKNTQTALKKLTLDQLFSARPERSRGMLRTLTRNNQLNDSQEDPYSPVIYCCQNQPLAPIILYLPADYPKISAYNTTNFNYSAENFELLCNLGKVNIIKHAPVIKSVLRQRCLNY